VNLLLDYGADVNTVTSRGESPLYVACSKGLTTIVERMLKCGAKVNVGKGQKCPLIAACKNKHRATVELLLNAGANPNVPQDVADECSFALHIVAADHRSELVNLLLKHGGNVTVQNTSGSTALHHAIGSPCLHSVYTADCEKVVETLIRAGADVNELMPDGCSPLCLLFSKYHNFRISHYGSRWKQKAQFLEHMIRMLISNGAKMDDSLAERLGDMGILEALSRWNPTNQLSAELLKAGAGFKLLALSCGHGSRRRGYVQHMGPIRVCQAAIMAGYRPSSEELEAMQQSLSDEDMIPEHVELLSWLNEDMQRVPSLMCQCRVVIRSQLSVALGYCSILSAIDQLPLPSCLQQYLKFEGNYTELDLEVKASDSDKEISDSDESEWSNVFDDHDSDSVTAGSDYDYAVEHSPDYDDYDCDYDDYLVYRDEYDLVEWLYSL